MKSHLCKVCGVTDPLLFYPKSKSKCKICTSKHGLQRLEQNPDKKELNKERSKQWQNENIFRYRWLRARYRALEKKIDFNLTPEFLEQQWDRQNGLCFYTAQPMKAEKSEQFDSVSVDRIDSDKGYTPDNVVLCRSICNIMKNSMTCDTFKILITQLYQHMVEPHIEV